MTTAVGKKATTALKISAEITDMRRRLARADALFEEGLKRLQADYKARVKLAYGESETLNQGSTTDESTTVETSPAA